MYTVYAIDCDLKRYVQENSGYFMEYEDAETFLATIDPARMPVIVPTDVRDAVEEIGHCVGVSQTLFGLMNYRYSDEMQIMNRMFTDEARSRCIAAAPLIIKAARILAGRE